jgi:Methyltransferase domain
MKQIEWLSDREFSVDGVRFLCALDDYSLKTNDDRLVILKDRESLESYAAVFSGTHPRTMLEFGIFQGGSPALFSLWFEIDKFVGIDLSAPVEEFDAFCNRHAVGRKIRTYYGISQTDKSRIDQIVHSEFGTTPLDVVIDDASHLYRSTRRAFEIAFPHLRSGGTYIIEDWGWAHWPGSRFFMGETALSMLIMELVMLCASRSDIVSEVRIFHSFAFIRKAPHGPSIPDMVLDSLYSKRGIDIIGADRRSLGSIYSNLLANRLFERANSKLQRLWERKGRV